MNSINAKFIAILSIGLIAMTSILFLQSGIVAEWFMIKMPPGQVYYLFSKWTGLGVLWCWQLQVFMQYAPKAWRPISAKLQYRWHRGLGTVIFFGALSHIVLFITGVSVRNGHFASKLLTLQFDSYYQTRVTLGLIAFLLLTLAVLPRFLSHVHKLFAKQKLNNAMHYLNLPAFLLVMWHALTIGSEAQSGVLLVGFIAAFTINILLFLFSLKR